MAIRRLELLVVTVVCVGCVDHYRADGGSPMGPEPHFRLTAEQRAVLRPDVELDALERLIERVPPENRAWVLSMYAAGSRSHVLRFEDPEMQALHERATGLERVASARADLAGGQPRLPIQIAIVPSVPEIGAGAVILRSSTPHRGDVILLPQAHASSFQLYVAIRALWAARQQSPTLGQPSRMVVRIAPRFVGPSAERVEARAEADFGPTLRAAQEAAPRMLDGVGRVRFTELQSDR
jgi:hypothetical protein